MRRSDSNLRTGGLGGRLDPPATIREPLREVFSPATMAFIAALAVATWSQADPPDLRTPAPVIYLADNLDERDGLGYCIDTVGRGFGDRLHAHSCKPRGGDVQFTHDAATRRIMSIAFPGKCASLLGTAAAGVGLGLFDCNQNSTAQAFDYDEDRMAFHAGGDVDLCLAVGAESRSAGPFMSRDLLILPCASTDATHRRWIVLTGAP